MNAEIFRQTLQNNEPPQGISPCLQALWYDANNNWEQSHQLIQDEPGTLPALIHAYLHRKEGDQGNAGYWYRRGGKAPFSGSLQEEWEWLVQACLNPQ
jgi:hypothetical protein